MDDYEAAFSDEDEEAGGKGQSLTDDASTCDIAASSVEETCNTAEVLGDPDSESPRPLSPGHVSAQYYYFYQGTLQRFSLKIALVGNSRL